MDGWLTLGAWMGGPGGRLSLCLVRGSMFFQPSKWGRHPLFHTRNDAPVIGSASLIAYKEDGRPIIFVCVWVGGATPPPIISIEINS